MGSVPDTYKTSSVGFSWTVTTTDIPVFAGPCKDVGQLEADGDRGSHSWSCFAKMSQCRNVSRDSMTWWLWAHSFHSHDAQRAGEQQLLHRSLAGTGKMMRHAPIQVHSSHFLPLCLINTNFPKGAKVHYGFSLAREGMRRELGEGSPTVNCSNHISVQCVRYILGAGAWIHRLFRENLAAPGI